MDPETKELLEKNLALNEENNRLLRGLRRANRIGFVWRIIYVGIFLGGAVIAANYLKPYYEGMMSTYQTVLNAQGQINEGFNKIMPR